MKVLAVIIVLLPLAAASAATITVNTTADNTTAGDGKCTLREAIANVNAAADTSAGDCAAGTGTGDTITFGFAMPAKVALLLGELRIQRDVSILNPAVGKLQVDGQQNTRVFEIAAGTTQMLNLTIQNGLQSDFQSRKGGGILVDAGATLAMDGCLISFNVAGRDDAGYGGGIYNSGTVSLVNSVLDANRATGPAFSGGEGGAIYNEGSGTLSLTDCRLTRNRAEISAGNVAGGAIANFGDLALSGCSFKGNAARADDGANAWGGAIANWGTTTASQCTFAQNAARAQSPAGGAIMSRGNLSLTDSTVSGNRVIGVSSFGSNDGSGGGIESSQGTLVLNNSVFRRNTVLVQNGLEGRGGAVTNWNSGTATVNACTFSGNAVMVRGGAGGESLGGGIYSYDALTVTGSTFSRNAVASPKASNREGGGVWSMGSVTMSNSTLVGNRARSCGASGGCQGEGGGLWVGETASLVNCTFSGNTADTPSISDAGGGAIGGQGQVTLTNSIVARSRAAGNCSPPDHLLVTSGGHNLSSDATCFTSGGTDLLSTNPRLGALKDNGGPTRTMALRPASAAIDAGDNAVCAAAPVNGVDQRGFVRPGAGSTNCSIGAYEYNAAAP